MAVTNFTDISNDISNDFCQLIESSYQIKIIFNERRLSYINIRLTTGQFCSGISS